MPVFVQDLGSPLGILRVFATEQAVTEIAVGEWEGTGTSNGITEEAVRQLSAYFSGTRQTFSLPLAPEGTAFQKKVWAALCRVPYGTSVTYGELGSLVGCGSARAIGQAVGRNPLMIVVPCHRVLAAEGRLGGFSAGLWCKEILLKIEKIPYKP